MFVSIPIVLLRRFIHVYTIAAHRYGNVRHRLATMKTFDHVRQPTTI